MPIGSEFEQLVPEIKYFEALASVIEVTDASTVHAAYTTWLEANPAIKRRAFTKRVGRWLEAEMPEKEAIAGSRKPDIMWKAVAVMQADQFESAAGEVCVKLLRAIRAQINETSYARQ